jgi:hypothetical protein
LLFFRSEAAIRTCNPKKIHRINSTCISYVFVSDSSEWHDG